jgi:hypothetical protein
MTDKPQRRPLRFNDLDEVVRDAEGLLAKGYDKAGNWDLAQVCGHLAEWLRFPVERFPKAPAPIRAVFWVLRKTVGRKKLLTYISTGSFPAGKPTMPESVPPPGGDPAAAVARLRAAAERFKAHTGPVHPSPLFGQLTKDEGLKLNLIHCAHHLSFLTPKQG